MICCVVKQNFSNIIKFGSNAMKAPCICKQVHAVYTGKGKSRAAATEREWVKMKNKNLKMVMLAIVYGKLLKPTSETVVLL